MHFPLQVNMTLIQAFSILPDPRTGPAQRHDLKEMIVMTLSSVLCGADNWVDVAEWAGDNESWLKKVPRVEKRHPFPRHLWARLSLARR